MGGCGSGRRTTYCGKDTTEESLPLDIRHLQRSGVLTPGQAFTPGCGFVDDALARTGRLAVDNAAR